ncbi:MAG: gliding motility-associated C-terminal domain-containing protein [Bacteroidia bacterium]
MLNNTPIEETFRTAFDNFEADVNPQVWTNIEKQITAPASPPAGSAASQAAKAVLTGSKFSAFTYGIASVVIIAVVAATYFYLKPDEKVASNLNPVTTTQQPSIIENKISAPAENITAETKHENHLSSQKLNENKVTKATPHVGGTAPVVIEPENVSSADKQNADAVTPPVLDNKHDANQKTQPEQPNPLGKNNPPATADEKHETPKEDGSTTEDKTLVPEQPSQDDSFDWGVIVNTFTPNNDGINDVFDVKTPDLKSLEVTISDRNGKTIFKWKNVRGFWDGKDFNGKEMQTGTYLYYIFAESANGQHHSKAGKISLFK